MSAAIMMHSMTKERVSRSALTNSRRNNTPSALLARWGLGSGAALASVLAWASIGLSLPHHTTVEYSYGQGQQGQGKKEANNRIEKPIGVQQHAPTRLFKIDKVNE